MTFDWRNMDDEAIAPHYSPRLAVPDADKRIAALAKRGAKARHEVEGWYDLQYGDSPRAVYDCHPAKGFAFGTPPPVLVYIHGGYWRALTKADHSWMAPPWMWAGAVVVNVEYDLCPNVTLDDIVEQIAHAVAHVHANAENFGGDPDRMVIAGHSAGAHLAAAMLRREDVAGLIKGAVCVSGIYEPEVVMRLPINDDVQLTADMARSNDCLAEAPRTVVPMVVAVGGDEPDGWQDQSRRYADVARGAGLAPEYLAVPGTNHFTVGEAMADADGPLFAAMRKLMAEV